jgi:hypothetical protein
MTNLKKNISMILSTDLDRLKRVKLLSGKRYKLRTGSERFLIDWDLEATYLLRSDPRQSLKGSKNPDK